MAFTVSDSSAASFITRRAVYTHTHTHTTAAYYFWKQRTVWFSCKHALAWCIFGADINHGQDTTGTQQATNFFDDAFSALFGCLVERIPVC
jgi:hypothetical protein